MLESQSLKCWAIDHFSLTIRVRAQVVINGLHSTPRRFEFTPVTMDSAQIRNEIQMALEELINRPERAT